MPLSFFGSRTTAMFAPCDGESREGTNDPMSEPDGTAVLEYPAETVIVIVAKGRVGATVGRRIAQEVAQALRGGPKAVFFDLEAMTDYHSDMRTHCTQA